MSSSPQVTIVLDGGRGNQEIGVLPGPGGTIRFAVGGQGRHAAVWKVWARRRKCSVYVAIRVLGRYQKVSLHESSDGGSDWRFQWTSEHMQANPQITDRKIDRWPRPPEVGETGWTTGVSIWTRHQDVVPVDDDESLPADLVWVPPPPEGYAVGLHVVIARPLNLSVELKGVSWPLAGFTLANGRVVLLVPSGELVTDETNHMIEDALAKTIESAPGGADQARIRLQARPHRMLVWGDGADGDRKAWDVAVEQANAAEQDEASA